MMTTLELAEAIVDAVISDRASAAVAEDADGWKRAGAQAVLRVLREQGCWFCRLSDGPKGETVEQMLPLE